MAGLNSILSIGSQALFAEQGALQVTSNNIANANTPGYSRELVNFEQAAPTLQGTVSPGNGVVLQGYQSVRDELLQLRVVQQTGLESSANAQLNSLNQVQSAFTTSAQDIGTEFTKLFSSVSALSTDPSNSSTRQALIANAGNLVGAFHTASTSLTTLQSNNDSQVKQDVTQINTLSAQIAAVGQQILTAGSAGQNTGILQDQQNQLVLNLSKLTDVSVPHTEGADTITTGSGTALVSGGKSLTLNTTTGADGRQNVLDGSGTDITTAIRGGDLGGTIQVRDQAIGGLTTTLDTLASQFAAAFNTAQTKGFDQNGAAGQALFTVPATVAGSAAGIALATTDPTRIAASSDGSVGSNGNIPNLSAVQTAALPAGENPINAYASIVFQVGSLTAGALAESSSTATSLQQLTSQRNSISGVSVDEESVNLVKFQNAYEAAARVITTVQSLFAATLAIIPA